MLREAEEIIQARDDAGVQVMVAYMRRFAPAFLQAIDEVRARLEEIGRDLGVQVQIQHENIFKMMHRV